MATPDAPLKKLGVVGLGYIGLPTAALFAARGISVAGFDVDPRVVDTVSRGEVHIIEPGLDIAVRSAVASGRLTASTRLEPCDAFIIAVPTPFGEAKVPDVSFIESATRALAPVLRKGNLVVLESTSPVGTTRAMARQLQALRPDLRFPPAPDGAGEDVYVAHCPERVMPGNVMRELIQNDRVVGGLSPRSTRRADALYRILVEGECVATDADTAELVKLTENAFRDVNIAFANELSLICGRLGLDVWEVIRLANRHPRVNILRPGPGVGGHCIAVDPWFIVHSAPEQANLIRAARGVNDGKPHFVVDAVKRAAQGLTAPVIACLGLAFKPDIDDLRESPAVEIVRALAQDRVGRLLVAEPNIDALPPSLAGRAGVSLVDAEDAIAQAHVVVILVNHKSFAGIDAARLAGKALINPCGWGR
jgi:UDP-N-acetyl-D-mannosaminuronic acid dehydrogenase